MAFRRAGHGTRDTSSTSRRRSSPGSKFPYRSRSTAGRSSWAVRPSSSTTRAVFHCVADARHFPGLVGFLNSLRLVGHTEEVVVSDAGLSPDQRRRLEEHATVRSPERELPPYVLKLSPSLEPPADVLVLVDADMILTRSLAEPIEIAAAGKIVAFADPVSPRFFPEWAGLLGLPPLRRQTYVNAGLLVLPEAPGRRLLGETVDLVAKLDIAETQHGTGSAEDPFFYYDQDVLNAVLAAEAEEAAVVDERLAPHPPFPGLELVDAEKLRCRYPDGTEPFVLHHVLAKPWLAATQVNLYQRLLRRVLLAPDVPLRLEPAELPLRLRDGFAAAADRARADLVARALALRGRLGLRRRLGRQRNG